MEDGDWSQTLSAGLEQTRGQRASPQGLHLLQAGASPSAQCYRGLGWVIIVEEKYLHQVSQHMAAVHPLLGEVWCLPRARMLRFGSGSVPALAFPHGAREKPWDPEALEPAACCHASPAAINSAAWPQGAGSN